MTDGRKRIRHVIAGLGVAALGGTALFTAPSHADPNIDDVQVRVDALYREAEQASERFNVLREELQQRRERLASLRADLERQRRKVEAVRDQVAASVLAQAHGQTLSSTSQVLLSEDPNEFLSQLSTISAFNDQRTQMMTDFVVQADRLDRRAEAARRKVATIARAKETLAEERAEVEEKAAEAAALLAELEAAERARLRALRERRAEAAAARAAAAQEQASRDTERTPVGQPSQDTAPAPAEDAARDTAPAPAEDAAPAEPAPEPAAPAPQPAAPAPSSSSGASAAVDYALAQVGDAYVYGAAGESSFDCSGLTLRAWAQAGVSLPHSSSGQMGSGTPVSSSQLQPGDLVFYYSPVSHVGIYVGNGQIVHAANPDTGVSTAPVYSMPLSGAVRPG